VESDYREFFQEQKKLFINDLVLFHFGEEKVYHIQAEIWHNLLNQLEYGADHFFVFALLASPG
jgi:hypothetical protein